MPKGPQGQKRSADDQTDDLRTPEAIEAFIEAAAETGDIVYQCDCELVVERARKRWAIASA